MKILNIHIVIRYVFSIFLQGYHLFQNINSRKRKRNKNQRLIIGQSRRLNYLSIGKATLWMMNYVSFGYTYTSICSILLKKINSHSYFITQLTFIKFSKIKNVIRNLHLISVSPKVLKLNGLRFFFSLQK